MFGKKCFGLANSYSSVVPVEWNALEDAVDSDTSTCWFELIYHHSTPYFGLASQSETIDISSLPVVTVVAADIPRLPV